MKNLNQLIEELQFDQEYQNKIYMPNEIFTELKGNAAIKNTPHLAFAYSYIYLIHWLYRHTKYLDTEQTIDTKYIKTLLGYHPDQRTMNYLIKKDGILEQMKWIETTNDIPVSVKFEEGTKILEFTRYSECEDENGFNYLEDYVYGKSNSSRNLSRNFQVKFPVRAFYRYPNDPEFQEDYKDGYDYAGTFNFIENTHLVPFDTFLHCMASPDIGCVGFYLYAYFRCKCQSFGGSYDVSMDNLVHETGIKSTSLKKYLDILKKFRLIDCIHNQEFFAVGMREQDRMANTYYVNDFDLFTDKPVSYKKISVMKKREYLKMLKEQEEKERASIVDIALEDLPY